MILGLLVRDMNFPEPFQTGSIQVNFISGNKNNKNDFFLSNFPTHQAFGELGEVAVPGFSENFRKLSCKNSMMEFMFSNAVVLSTVKDILLTIF